MCVLGGGMGKGFKSVVRGFQWIMKEGVEVRCGGWKDKVNKKETKSHSCEVHGYKSWFKQSLTKWWKGCKSLFSVDFRVWVQRRGSGRPKLLVKSSRLSKKQRTTNHMDAKISRVRKGHRPSQCLVLGALGHYNRKMAWISWDKMLLCSSVEPDRYNGSY